ncbi:unnamed protein product, partial [Mesorhabditis spiculigera]
MEMSSDLVTGDELMFYYAFYETRDPAGPRIRIIGTGDCEKLKAEHFLVVLADGKTLNIERIYVLGSSDCPGFIGGHCKMPEMELSTSVFFENHRKRVLDEKRFQEDINARTFCINCYEEIAGLLCEKGRRRNPACPLDAL